MNTTSVAAKPKTIKHFFTDNFDLPLGIAVITLMAIGFLMVYSASWQYLVNNGLSQYYTVTRQIAWALVGIVVVIFLTFFDYHRIRRWVVLIMLVTLALLLAVLIFGDNSTGGPQRGLFNGSIQPSELAKLVIILYLCFWLYSKHDVLDQWSFGLIPLMTILGITAGLILAQPDVSAAATIILLGGILFYIANGKLRQILTVIVVAGLLGFLVVMVYKSARIRLVDYWNGIQNPEHASDQVKWSLEAIINGGFFGAGIGRSTTKFIGLPVAQTDSIFAVITEELGLLGAFVVIALYIVILWRGLTISSRSKDDLGKWLAAGVTLWIFLEAAINIGTVVNLIPVAGNALPFISAGGSNMVTMLAGIGILMGIARQSKLSKSVSEGSSRGAVVDLRRGDRRRSISRPVDPSGTH
ncbi:MAG: FtsW/RodA/SpoVE family cell cycle protein [Anaerolineaceae bacterium]